MAVDFSTFVKNLGIGKNTPTTSPTPPTTTQPQSGGFLSKFMGGVKKVGGDFLTSFNRQRESLYGDTSGSLGNQFKTSLPGKVITQGVSNYKQNLKLISDPNTQEQFTNNVGPLRQAAVNYTLAPLAQVPYNVKQATDKSKSGFERGSAAFNAAIGAAQVIPGFTGVDDLVMALYNGLKGYKLAQKEGKNIPQSFKEAGSYLTGQKYAGLGDVAFNEPGQQTFGNIAELPLLVFGSMSVAKKKQTAETVKQLEPQILSTIRSIRNYDKFSPSAQMNIIQDTVEMARKVIPDVINSTEMKKLSNLDPQAWMKTVSTFLEDRLVSVKNPELNFGFNTRKLKKLPDEVINGADEVVDATKNIPEGQLERGLITSVKESPLISPEVKQTVEGTYTPLVNAETMAKAEKMVAENEAKALESVLGNDFNADISAQGIALAKKYEQAGDIEKADVIWEKLAEKATEAGQGTQALAMLGSGSPKVMEKFTQKVIDQANQTRGGILNKLFGTKKIEFTDQLKKEIDDLMAEARRLPAGEQKNAAVLKVINRVAQEIPPTASEVIDAYRYNNMLSNPNTWGVQGRNAWFNLQQTFFTKPASMAFEAVNDVILSTLTGKEREHYLKEIPAYYKAIYNAIPEAAQASLDILSGKSAVKHPDLTDVTQSQLYDILREARQQQIPGNLDLFFGPEGQRVNSKNVGEAGKYVFTKLFSNLMEMNDRAFSTLIASGEYAAQKSRGVADDVAKQAADDLAKYYLGRTGPDPLNKSGQGTLLSAIDAVEAKILSLRSFAPVKWMVPFVNMATQAAKQTVEFSPYGLLTLYKNADKSKQLAKVSLGTTATMLATLMVASNDVTWEAPSDETERQLFYASGRKPYSIRIGNTWVPINTFGPLSLAVGTVAAWKYYHDQDPKKFTTTEGEKLVKTLTSQLKRFGSQPMLQGLYNFAQVASGNTDYTTPSSLAFTAGQVIPLNGMLRYISQILDPVFRSVKGEGFLGSIKKDLPFLSKDLLPYLDPEGNPSKRNVTDFVAPYSMGFTNEFYDTIYQKIQQTKQIKGISSTAETQINAIKDRIDIIAKDQSLTDEQRKKKIDAEIEKINKIANELESNQDKVGPMVTPQ